jgi:hypothetical protein
MVRDLIFFIHALFVAILGAVLYKDGVLTVENGTIMVACELFVFIMLIIPEIFFKNSKLAKFLTKKILI